VTIDRFLAHGFMARFVGEAIARDFFGIQARSWRPSLLPLVKQWLHNREQIKAAQ
jgi:dTDP-4-dehydrorhamnose reductase